MTRDMIDDDNWALVGPTSPPIKTATSQSPNAFIVPTVTDNTPSSHMSSSTDQLARRDITSSPAMADGVHRLMRPSSAGSQSGWSHILQYDIDTHTIASPQQQQQSLPTGGQLLHPRMAQLQQQEYTPRTARRMGEHIAKTTTQYTETVLSRSTGGGSTNDMKKTMKAAKIQHDVVSQ